MIKRNSINNGLVKAFILACLALVFLSGCIPNQPYNQTTTVKKPGLYSVKGWNYASCHYYKGKKTIDTCTSKDIDGKVGYQLYVTGMRANCVPGGKWSTSKKIITSGSLPPGLAFQGGSIIKGIPEKRGHWIVNIKVEHLYCNDISYYGLQQELRFHITGSGKVRH